MKNRTQLSQKKTSKKKLKDFTWLDMKSFMHKHYSKLDTCFAEIAASAAITSLVSPQIKDILISKIGDSRWRITLHGRSAKALAAKEITISR